MPKKGGYVHNRDKTDVSKVHEDEYWKILLDIQSGKLPDTYQFPPTLNSEQRKFIHFSCKKLGLVSKSQGKGRDRFLTVRCPAESKQQDAKAEYIQLSAEQKHIISTNLQNDKPITSQLPAKPHSYRMKWRPGFSGKMSNDKKKKLNSELQKERAQRLKAGGMQAMLRFRAARAFL